MSEQERQPTDNSERPRTAQGARRTSKEQTQQAITASSPAQEAAASVSASDPADSTAPQSPAPSHPLAPTGRGDGQCRRVSQDLRRQFEGIQDPVTTALVGANFVGLEQGSLRQAPYDALKAALQQRFHAKSELMKALEQLEAKPNSPGRRATLREEVVLELADHDTDFRTRAYDLLAKLPRSAWENLPGGYLEPENPDGRIDWTASYSALLLHIKGLFSSIYNRQ